MRSIFWLLRLGLLGGLLLLISSFQNGINQVEADCAPGYTCSGVTVLDVGRGCKPYPGYCTQGWTRYDPIYCDSSCGVGRYGWDCYDKTPPCNFQSEYYSTNCCVGEEEEEEEEEDGNGGGCDWATKPNVAPGTCTQANGLWGHYYRDNPIGDPRFDGGLKLERNDSQVNFDWGGGAPDTNLCSDNFSSLWTGYVNLSSSGTWRFGMTSDDGVAVDLEMTPGNWVRVMSDWSDHPPQTSWGSWYALNTGWYGIRVWFYENGGGAVAQLRYERQGSGGVIIPAPSLLTCSAPIQGPTNPTVTNITASSAQLNWTRGSGGTKQLIRVGDDLAQVNFGCPAGVGPGTGCVIKNDNYTACAPNSPCSFSTGPILSPGTRYYWRVVEWLDASTWADFGFTPSFTTKADPWVQAINGLIHANHLTSLKVAPSGQFNSRWAIFGRGSVTGTSQEGWIGQWYPERNFDLTQNTPIKTPDYATLFKRFGGGATPFTGPSLPNSSGAWVISGNKIVNGVFNQAAGTNILIFVSDDGDLTVDAEIRVPATSTIAFIVSGEIKFSKDFAGGGGGIDNLGGIYIAEGRINTAYDKTAPDEITRQLVIEGGLISLTDTISLDRNLDPAANNTTPAEQINLSAKHYVLLKSVLGRPKFFYREVPAGF